MEDSFGFWRGEGEKSILVLRKIQEGQRFVDAKERGEACRESSVRRDGSFMPKQPGTQRPEVIHTN